MKIMEMLYLALVVGVMMFIMYSLDNLSGGIKVLNLIAGKIFSGLGWLFRLITRNKIKNSHDEPPMKNELKIRGGVERGVFIWEQDGQKELTIILPDRTHASLIADTIKNKKVSNAWVEKWTGGFAVRIEYGEK